MNAKSHSGLHHRLTCLNSYRIHRVEQVAVFLCADSSHQVVGQQGSDQRWTHNLECLLDQVLELSTWQRDQLHVSNESRSLLVVSCSQLPLSLRPKWKTLNACHSLFPKKTRWNEGQKWNKKFICTDGNAHLHSLQIWDIQEVLHMQFQFHKDAFGKCSTPHLDNVPFS